MSLWCRARSRSARQHVHTGQDQGSGDCLKYVRDGDRTEQATSVFGHYRTLIRVRRHGCVTAAPA